MMNTPEIGAILYTSPLEIPRSAEYSFTALSASLVPPIIITNNANTRINTSIAVISTFFRFGDNLSLTSTNAICCLVLNA